MSNVNEHLKHLFNDEEIYNIDRSIVENTDTPKNTPPPTQGIKKEQPESQYHTGKVYVFVDYEISDTEKAFLEKVLAAVDINLNQDCVITKWESKHKAYSGKNFVFSEHVNSCGITSERISGPMLQTIANNVDLKRSLWENMQKIFKA